MISTLALTGAVVHGVWLPHARADEVRFLRIELLVFRGLGQRQIEMVKGEVETIWAAQEVTVDWTGGESAERVRVMIDRPASAPPAATHRPALAPGGNPGDRRTRHSPDLCVTGRG
jgi:hypothetical protein